jgi:hypothetical protein
MSSWDAEGMKHALDLEMQGVLTEGGETLEISPQALSNKIAVETLPMAMRRISHIACYSEDEGRALSAATYIVNRVLGKLGDAPMIGAGEKDKLAAMVDAAMGGSE